MPEPQDRCRSMLVIEESPQAVSEAGLRRALGVGDVAAVVIRGLPGAPVNVTRARGLARAAQSAGAAALVWDDCDLARMVGADGVHLDVAGLSEEEAVARYTSARAALGSEASIGAGAGLSRHLAMVLGERGAEYVAFGPAAAEEAQEQELLDLVGWWSEVTVVPTVAFLADAAAVAQARALAAAGADFVAVEAPEGEGLAGLVGALEAALAGPGRG